jgi:hypothetical protein
VGWPTIWQSPKVRRRVLAMNRRLVMLVAILLAVVPYASTQHIGDAPQKSTEQGCRKFVQDFYDWYVPVALQDQNFRAWDIALRLRPSAFDPTLVRLLKRDSEAQSKSNELVGLDLDPILASQDPSERFAVQRVARKGLSCTVTVLGLSSGVRREKVVADVRFRNGHWRFVNFIYSSGNQRWDLIHYLNDLEDGRQSDSKKQQ